MVVENLFYKWIPKFGNKNLSFYLERQIYKLKLYRVIHERHNPNKPYKTKIENCVEKQNNGNPAWWLQFSRMYAVNHSESSRYSLCSVFRVLSVARWVFCKINTFYCESVLQKSTVQIRSQTVCYWISWSTTTHQVVN